MRKLPSFLIIGAMKSATTTLYEQLLRQPGIFLPKLKEPNFFSDDQQYVRGLDWYEELFNDAQASDILGEASTHYAKLPTYPQTIVRMRNCLESPRLVYVMRHPIDRLISQYVHQWSEGGIGCDLDEAVTRHPELIAYSSYAMQLTPYVDAYGRNAIIPIFFDRMKVAPQNELERICRFVGYKYAVQWRTDISPSNISAERFRKFPFYNLLVDNPIAASLRRTLVPKSIRTKVRQFFSMRRRPLLAEKTRKHLEKIFDEDLSILGDWLGTRLDCDNFHKVTSTMSLNWK